MRRSLALCALMLAAFATNAFAIGEARLTGKVTDATTKQPIKDAVVTVVATEAKTFKQDFKVNPKDGSYAIFLIDGTIKYKFTFSAPGHAPYEEVMKLKLGEPNVKDVVLSSGVVATSRAVSPEAAKPDPSVALFNEGATLANAGDVAGAIAKIEEAVAKKPDFVAGYGALARLYPRQKDYKKAIDAANKALSFDPDQPELYGVLYESYNATGDKAKAAEAKKMMPANAAVLFNDAAKLINANKDSDAEPLLKQAIAADEKFAKAYYELGMIYVRGGKSAEAKANLQKYLELEPNGSDAATAKEMLKYVQ